MHKLYDDLFKRLWEYLVNRPQKRIYMVVGPTGVGKSVLAAELKSKIATLYRDASGGTIGCLYVSAASEGSQAFPFKDLYLRILRELGEPLVNRKIPYIVDGHGLRMWNPTNIRNRSAHTIRLAVEEALMQRGVRVLFIDEAQSMIRSRTDKASYSALETLKTLSNALDLNIVLLGNDELLDLQHYNDQFNRRIKQFLLRAYNMQDADELGQFLGILKSMCPAFHRETGLDGMASPIVEHLIEQSAGCIGLLNDQLQDICTELSASSNRSLTEILPKVKLTPVQMKVIRERQKEFGCVTEVVGKRATTAKRSGKRTRVEPNPRRDKVEEHESDPAESITN